MSKIVICGLNGSGKTTLGKELAKAINYKHKDIEDYYFVDNNDYKYTSSLSKEEVIKKLEDDFNKNDNIVFTVCNGNYGNLSSKYDLAILIEWFEKLLCDKMEIDGSKTIEENLKIVLTKLKITQ